MSRSFICFIVIGLSNISVVHFHQETQMMHP